MQSHLHKHNASTVEVASDASPETGSANSRLAGWSARHQAVARAGGWRALLKEPIDKRNWDRSFSRDVAVDSLFSRALVLQPGLQQEFKALAGQTFAAPLDPARRRTVSAVVHQQHQTLERYVTAWASQNVWLLELQVADIRDIQAELASRMTAAGNWPAKELLQWKIRLSDAQKRLDSARIKAEQSAVSLRFSLQLGAQSLSFSEMRFLEPGLWSSPILDLNLDAIFMRAQDALDKAPGIQGVPIDLWQGYQQLSIARDHSQLADRAFERGKEQVALSSQILEEAVLKYNGMFMSTFELLDHRIEKLHVDNELVELKAEAIKQQSMLLRSAIQARLIELDFGVRL